MAKHRPVNQRIAETMAHLASLQAKANKEAVNDDPRIGEIDNRIREINNSMLKYNRWASEWETKVEDFEKRVATWISRGEKADAWLAQYKEDMSALKEKRNLTAAEVAKEMSV